MFRVSAGSEEMVVPRMYSVCRYCQMAPFVVSDSSSVHRRPMSNSSRNGISGACFLKNSSSFCIRWFAYGPTLSINCFRGFLPFALRRRENVFWYFTSFFSPGNVRTSSSRNCCIISLKAFVVVAIILLYSQFFSTELS